jgi:hypothetical protein
LAYLRWSDSNWYAYTHADGGVGDDAVFKAMHGSGPTLLVTAAELRRAGVQGDPRGLQNWMASMGGLTDRVLSDVGELSPAADQFLFEAYNAGKLMMPPELARRYRVLRRLLRRNAERGSSNHRLDAEAGPSGQPGSPSCVRSMRPTRHRPFRLRSENCNGCGRSGC